MKSLYSTHVQLLYSPHTTTAFYFFSKRILKGSNLEYKPHKEGQCDAHIADTF